MHNDLLTCFHRHLDPEVALSAPQLNEAFRLRYRVYCEETGFEDPGQFPDGCERDRFDLHSIQLLVRHRPTGIAVGTVRLILPCWWAASWTFPFENASGQVALGHREEELSIARRDAAEVSRFAVSRKALAAIQKPAVDRWANAPQSCDDPRRPAQLVAYGLGALLFGASAEYGISTWYAMMELSLARHLSRVGIQFRQIGPPVEHRGTRYPMMARVDDLRARISDTSPPYARLIDDICDSVLAQGIEASTKRPAAHPHWTVRGPWQPGGPFADRPPAVWSGGTVEPR